MKAVIRTFLRYKKSANLRAGSDYNAKMNPIIAYFAQLSRQLSMKGWITELWGKTTVFRLPSSKGQGRVIFYVHGGSFTAPTSPAHFRFCNELAREVQAEVYIIEYDLAPDVKYPAIHDQCREMITTIVNSRGDYSEIILAGDSAGAGILPAIFNKLEPEIASQVKASLLISPWLDYDGSSLSAKTREQLDPWLNSRGVEPVALLYFDNIENIAMAQASMRISLDDQPPTFISVGEAEILFSDSIELFATLLNNGVLASIYVGRSLWHVWPLFPISERRHLLAEVASFLEILESPNSKFHQ